VPDSEAGFGDVEAFNDDPPRISTGGGKGAGGAGAGPGGGSGGQRPTPAPIFAVVEKPGRGGGGPTLASLDDSELLLAASSPLSTGSTHPLLSPAKVHPGPLPGEEGGQGPRQGGPAGASTTGTHGNGRLATGSGGTGSASGPSGSPPGGANKPMWVGAASSEKPRLGDIQEGATLPNGGPVPTMHGSLTRSLSRPISGLSRRFTSVSKRFTAGLRQWFRLMTITKTWCLWGK
jgi:hypothetical protein